MIWEDYKTEFTPDGQLRDVYIKNANSSDWQSMINFLRSTQASLFFYIDGRAASLPPQIDTILADQSHHYLMNVQLGGINVECDFNSPEQIQLMFDPREINDEFKAKLIFRLMSTIGRTLNKAVFCAAVSQEEKPVFQYRPGETVEYLENDDSF